eukprot:477648-Alexandrium_andersonii.AAC.1
MPIAALLSAQTSREAANSTSWAMATKPRPSAAPSTMPASSASPELNAMVFCVVAQCLVAHRPRTHAPPHVERRARKHPAKSASTYTQRGAPSPCHGRWQTHLGRTIR